MKEKYQKKVPVYQYISWFCLKNLLTLLSTGLFRRRQIRFNKEGKYINNDLEISFDDSNEETSNEVVNS